MTTDYKLYNLGAQPSPSDNRDYPITRLVPMLNDFPSEFAYEYNHEVKNQGLIGSCVAHSLTYCREITEEKQLDQYTKLSTGCIYGLRQAGDWQSSGMFPRQALECLLKTGVCSWDVFPYNEEYPAIKTLVDQYKDKIIEDAKPHKISAYARVYTIDEIKSALMQVSPVTFCMAICESFYCISNRSPMYNPSPELREKILGYHEMTITGWKMFCGEPVFVVLNSWGEKWGEGGYFYYPFKVFEEQNYVSEVWTISDNIIPHPEPEPLPQPTPSNIFYRVVTGSFANRENVNERINALKSKGFNSFTLITEVNGKQMFRCITGSFNDRSKAEQRINDLKIAGFDSFITIYKK